MQTFSFVPINLQKAGHVSENTLEPLKTELTQFPNGFHLNPLSPQSDQHQFSIISTQCNQDTG